MSVSLTSSAHLLVERPATLCSPPRPRTEALGMGCFFLFRAYLVLDLLILSARVAVVGAELRVETEALHASKLLVASGGEQGRIIKIGRFRASTLDNTTLRTPCSLEQSVFNNTTDTQHRFGTLFFVDGTCTRMP